MTRTPGPWTVEDYGDDDAPILVIHRDTDNRVCFMAMPGSHDDRAEIEANARLIAARHDMLAALESAIFALCTVEITTETAAAKHRIRAAIAKATGES